MHENNTASLKCLTSGKFLKYRVNLDTLKRQSYYRLMPGSVQYQNATEIIDGLHVEDNDKNHRCRNVDLRQIIETIPPQNDSNRQVGPLYAPKVPYTAIKIKVD
jgi:hypothetical protein